MTVTSARDKSHGCNGRPPVSSTAMGLEFERFCFQFRFAEEI